MGLRINSFSCMILDCHVTAGVRLEMIRIGRNRCRFYKNEGNYGMEGALRLHRAGQDQIRCRRGLGMNSCPLPENVDSRLLLLRNRALVQVIHADVHGNIFLVELETGLGKRWRTHPDFRVV